LRRSGPKPAKTGHVHAGFISARRSARVIIGAVRWEGPMSRAYLSLGFLCVLAVALRGGTPQANPTSDALRTASFLYVANDRAGTISAFRIDGATGALAPLANASIVTDKNPYSVAIDADGRRLYVVHGDASSIVAFSIDPIGGEIKRAPISRTETGAYPVFVAIDPDGRFLYVSTMVANAIAVYAINPITGALTPAPG